MTRYGFKPPAIVLLLLLAASLTACQKNSGINPPVTDPMGEALRVSNATLNLATDYYSSQQKACGNGLSTCRFSSSALESFRSILVKVNNSFKVATATYEEWRMGIATQSQVQTDISQLQSDTNELVAACGPKGCGNE